MPPIYIMRNSKENLQRNSNDACCFLFVRSDIIKTNILLDENLTRTIYVSKGKPMIIQIIEICRKRRVPLYMAFVDLEEAFDKVSLLAGLVSLGLSHIMLVALKRICSYTLCILCFYGCFSAIFITKSGIIILSFTFYSLHGWLIYISTFNVHLRRCYQVISCTGSCR